MKPNDSHGYQLYCGNDIVSIGRLKKILEQQADRFTDKIFTKREIEQSKYHPSKLAVCFAGKEAVAKALEVGFNYLAKDGIDPKEVEIILRPSKPAKLRLYGSALQLSEALGIFQWKVSVAHEQSYATAYVVAISLK